MKGRVQPLPYREITGLDGGKVVLLDWDEQPENFCNLLKLNVDGTLHWVATPRHPLEGVWTDMAFEDGNLRAYNMAGFSDLIDYATGRILQRSFVK